MKCTVGTATVVACRMWKAVNDADVPYNPPSIRATYCADRPLRRTDRSIFPSTSSVNHSVPEGSPNPAYRNQPSSGRSDVVGSIDELDQPRALKTNQFGQAGPYDRRLHGACRPQRRRPPGRRTSSRATRSDGWLRPRPAWKTVPTGFSLQSWSRGATGEC